MESKGSIAIFDTKPYDREFFEAANADFGYTLKFFRPRLNADTVRLAEGFSAVCAFVNDTLSEPVTRELDRLGIRLIALRCAGYNNVDLKSVYNRIHVVRVPAYSPHAVAEHAVALALTLNRKTHKAYSRTRDGNFSLQGLMGFDLHGKTAGIIGTGKIGRIAAGIFRGFGMRVLAYDPFPHPTAAAESGFDYVDLDTLYRESDLLSLHCPLTPETRHLIRKESIAKMKPGVMILNTGRGKLIHTKDLIQGLKSRRIGAAGLDVYEEEETYFFEDFSSELLDDDVLARLLTFPNVLITSHQAFFTKEALDNIARTTLNNIRAFFAGERLENEICYQCDSGCRRATEGRCF
ncbi:MAG: 2-hydroxyacid dehydrogenase [Kiritimatiellia bacterium]|nr:2-hydroxyacid dehydrogenase [Kiritimatiellia bacterium]